MRFEGDTVYGVARATAQPVRMHPRQLVDFRWQGAVCDGPSCEPILYRIVSVASDTSQNTMPSAPSNRDVWMYEVEYALASAGAPSPEAWHSSCGGSPSRPVRGVFVNGRWTQDGSYHAAGWSFSCPDGVIAKCVRAWGYKPWRQMTLDSGQVVELGPLHRACVRAARADYCGDGQSHTRDGTLVDIFDRYGLNVREDVAGFTSESGFDQDGALWVNHPRWPTATATASGWQFATCARSREDSAPDAEPLLYVWSDPSRARR